MVLVKSKMKAVGYKENVKIYLVLRIEYYVSRIKYCVLSIEY